MTRGKSAVIGLGYTGLPIALAMADAGYDVIGVDVDESKIEQLNSGESYVTDIPDTRVSQHLGDRFEPTTEYDSIADVSLVTICVPTPLRKTDSPDLSFVVEAVEALSEVISTGTVAILESTVYPGATEEIIAPILEENGHEIGDDVNIAFSPERIDPGNESYGVTDIPKIIGGVTASCTERAVEAYEPIFDTVVPVKSARDAEFVKLLENTFRAVNIGLANELAMVADELDINIWDAIDAAATKPFGYMPFYPGPGLGGHCIPVDPTYLSWKANQYGVDTKFIELADNVNRQMPHHVVRRIIDLLDERGQTIAGSDILIVGVAYKPGVSDTRESPAVDIITEFRDRNADIRYHDPHVGRFEVGATTFVSTEMTAETARECDCAVIVTDHPEINYDLISEHAPLVFDTRYVLGNDGGDNIYTL